ncbi:hypothetical protein ACSNOI_02280 [Actinomadura kijaniata]|uniref:hypothetical protein n=1 Tax=Actinomadura kijaniata TaxID=46161 RepID=UPI003F1C79E2
MPATQSTARRQNAGGAPAGTARPDAAPGDAAPDATGRTGPSPLDRAERAERVAAAATGVDGVAGLTAGPRGRLVTYRVGAPVAGVAFRDADVEIGLVAEYGRVLPELADAVRAAVLPLAGGRPVHVLVADLADPAAPEEGDA